MTAGLDLAHLPRHVAIVMDGNGRWATRRGLKRTEGHAAGEHALSRPFSQTTIELCQLGPDAVALGAATLPIARLLADGGIRPAVTEAVGAAARVQAALGQPTRDQLGRERPARDQLGRDRPARAKGAGRPGLASSRG